MDVGVEGRWPLVASPGGADCGLNRLPLGVAVTRRMRQEIVFGTLQPGSRLTEKELGDRYGVSRTPVREALRTLESEGVAVRTGPVTISVPNMDKSDARVLYETCAAVEGLAGRQVSMKPLSSLAALRSCLEDLVLAVDSGDSMAVLTRESDFHNTIISLSGNVYAVRFTSSVQTLLNRYGWFSSLATPERVASAVSMHRTILTALESGDADAAEGAVRAHIMTRLETLESHLSVPQAEVGVVG